MPEGMSPPLSPTRRADPSRPSGRRMPTRQSESEKITMLRAILLAGIATALMPAAAFAQSAPTDDGESQAAPAKDAPDDPHADHTQDIIITGFSRNREDLVPGAAGV